MNEDNMKEKVVNQLAEMQRQLDEMKRTTSMFVNEQEVILTEETSFQHLFDTAQALADYVEGWMPYKKGHQWRVADLARAIAVEMNLSKPRIRGVHLAGMLHDIGMISIDSLLINKLVRYTAEEFECMKTHVLAGFEFLKSVDFPWPVARIVMEHHERIDGSGYPGGLTGDRLLLESKILTVADVVDAIASHRPYRPAFGVESALYDIAGERGTLYDKDVVDVCLLLFNEKGYKRPDD